MKDESGAESLRTHAPATAGEVLAAIRTAAGITRAALADRTALSRMALNHRLALLTGSGLVVRDGHDASTGGRPSERFAFNARAGLVVGFDVGIRTARIGIADLACGILAETNEEVSLDDGPEAVLDSLCNGARSLLARSLPDGLDMLRAGLGRAGLGRAGLWGAGIGVPGPVEFEQGRVVSAPFMPGWQGFAIRAGLTDRLGCPAVVDKDANIMALGEYRTAWADVRQLLFVKAATGIGCGIIADGQIYRGANGAAGDIGHTQTRDYGDEPCRCGNTGCVEAIAGGWALLRDLRARGADVRSVADVVDLARRGDPEVLQLVRRSGRVLGDALADAVNFFNPAVLVLGGALVPPHGELVAGVREIVYKRSLALATRDLRIAPAVLGDRAGVVGAVHLVIDHILTPAAIDQWLLRRGVDRATDRAKEPPVSGRETRREG